MSKEVNPYKTLTAKHKRIKRKVEEILILLSQMRSIYVDHNETELTDWVDSLGKSFTVLQEGVGILRCRMLGEKSYEAVKKGYEEKYHASDTDTEST